MSENESHPLVELKFFYVKNSGFRVVHVDGVTGGLTPTRNIHMVVYSERPAIPLVTSHTLDNEGDLGPQKVLEGKQGIVRELDFDAIFSLDTAVRVRDWLTSRIDQLKALQEEPDEASVSEAGGDHVQSR